MGWCYAQQIQEPESIGLVVWEAIEKKLAYLWYILEFRAICERYIHNLLEMDQATPARCGVKPTFTLGRKEQKRILGLTECPPVPLHHDHGKLWVLWRHPRGDNQKDHCCWNEVDRKTECSVRPCPSTARIHSINLCKSIKMVRNRDYHTYIDIAETILRE